MSKTHFMKKFFLFLAFIFSLLTFSISAFSVSTSTSFIILPGYFYFTISGALQSGVLLSGLKPADNVTSQVGFWNSERSVDYLYFFDSSSVPGFRIRMYLDGDFEYVGSYSEQESVPLENFAVYSNWDSFSDEGLVPTVGVDDYLKTLVIDGANSCKPDSLMSFSDYYFFDSDFYSSPYGKFFSEEPFQYLISTNSCKNQGRIYIGRFQLNLGVVKPGEYKSSLYIVMLDGY